ncbi:MAG: ferredoxin [Thalassobius sp.]|nr:ferredoxin [Thalassovita sp.]
MSKKITDIEGIGPAFAEKLAKANIRSVEKLLEIGANKSGRKNIASSSGVDEGKVLDWVNMADLFRVKGIAGQFAELLKAAGVDTIKELRNRNAENLHAKLVEVNTAKKLTRVVPSLTMVEKFIDQAKALEPKVTY